jgi:hypothetical protein
MPPPPRVMAGVASRAPLPEHLAALTWHARDWAFMQATLTHEAAAFKPWNGTSLVLLGDSLTEGWRGTCQGKQLHKFDGVTRVADRMFKHPLLLFGICNDITAHVRWRLVHGGEV